MLAHLCLINTHICTVFRTTQVFLIYQKESFRLSKQFIRQKGLLRSRKETCISQREHFRSQKSFKDIKMILFNFKNILVVTKKASNISKRIFYISKRPF